MLYIWKGCFTLSSMSNKPAIPQEIEPGSAHYSLRAEIKVNGWSWVAVLTSFAGEVLLLPKHPEWPTALRTAVALIPLVASLLRVRSLMRWVRGMDELQRRITTAASLFATATTLVVIGALHPLTVAGVFPQRFQATAGFVVIWLVVCFYLLGRGIFSRRYA